jgi:hypothetical protein
METIATIKSSQIFQAQYIIYLMNLSKGQSEAVYRRRTDNTMAKRKSTKGQKTINKTYI